MKDEKFSFIGDYLGTIEEFVPGDGTLSEDGKIYASQMGNAVIDREKHAVSVEGRKLPHIEVGQTVFAEVGQSRKNMVSVNIAKIFEFDEQLNEKAAIYVTNIADKYVERVEDMFGIGDIVKAKVIKVENGLIDVSTKGDFGVLKAFCKRCRNELVEEQQGSGRMKCGFCGSKENRKTAKDYANVKVI